MLLTFIRPYEATRAAVEGSEGQPAGSEGQPDGEHADGRTYGRAEFLSIHQDFVPC